MQNGTVIVDSGLPVSSVPIPVLPNLNPNPENLEIRKGIVLNSWDECVLKMSRLERQQK